MNGTFELGSHRLAISETGEGHRLVISGGDAAAGLEIALGADGAVLRLGGALRLLLDGDLDISARNLRLHGRDGAALTAGNDVTIEALRGDATLRANDDVRLDGERIRNNC